jgi:RNA polymerase sigma-70 factor (ECF subfamily)
VFLKQFNGNCRQNGKNRILGGIMEALETTNPSDLNIEILLNKYGKDIKKLAYMYVRDWGKAEDITQEVFIICYKKIHLFRGDSSYKTWLYKITVNKCKDELKRKDFWQFRLADKLKHHLPKSERTTEEQVITKSEDQELAEKVLSLPVKYREVIILFYYEGLKIKEIHELTGLNIETIKTRLSRAKKMLHKMYEGRGIL